jgi:hypothetical protein
MCSINNTRRRRIPNASQFVVFHWSSPLDEPFERCPDGLYCAARDFAQGYPSERDQYSSSRKPEEMQHAHHSLAQQNLMKTSPNWRRTSSFCHPVPAYGCLQRYPSICAYLEDECGCDTPPIRRTDFLSWEDFIFWIRAAKGGHSDLSIDFSPQRRNVSESGLGKDELGGRFPPCVSSVSRGKPTQALTKMAATSLQIRLGKTAACGLAGRMSPRNEEGIATLSPAFSLSF